MPLPPIDEVLGTAPKKMRLPPIEEVLGAKPSRPGLPPIEEVLAGDTGEQNILYGLNPEVTPSRVTEIPHRVEAGAQAELRRKKVRQELATRTAANKFKTLAKMLAQPATREQLGEEREALRGREYVLQEPPSLALQHPGAVHKITEIHPGGNPGVTVEQTPGPVRGLPPIGEAPTAFQRLAGAERKSISEGFQQMQAKKAQEATPSITQGGPPEPPKAPVKHSEGGMTHPFSNLLTLVDTPFRAVGGAFHGAQQTLDWLVNGIGPQPPGVFRQALDSITEKNPQYIANTIVDAARTWKGSELSTGERVAAQIAGLAGDLIIGGKAFPRFGDLPKSPQIGRQIARAANRAGAKIRPGAVERLGEVVLEKGSAPEQIAKARQLVKTLSRKAGVDEKLADEYFRRIIGPEGKELGRSWFHMPGGKRELIPSPRAKISELLHRKPPEPRLPRGILGQGTSFPVPARRAMGQVQWGSDLPPGAIPIIRKADALKARHMYEGAKGGALIEKSLRQSDSLVTKIFGRGLPESERTALAAEVDFLKQQLPKEINQLIAEAGEGSAESVAKEIAAKKAGFASAMQDINRAGLTPEEMVKGVAGLKPESQQALNLYMGEMQKMYHEAKAAGVNVEELQGSVSRIAKQKTLRRKIADFMYGTVGEGRKGAKGAGVAAEQFAKHRLPIEAGVSIAQGAGGRREMLTRLGEIYAARKYQQALSVSNATLENGILEKFARPAGEVDFSRIAKESRKTAGALGDLYTAQAGIHKGETFILDRQLVKLLERANKAATDPSAFMNGWKKLMGWWKGRATISRPAFAVRNIGAGNTMQLWMADVNPSSMKDAIQILARRWARSPFAEGGNLPKRAWLSELFTMGKASEKRIAGKSLDELVDMLGRSKVTGTGWSGVELSNLGREAGGSMFSPWNLTKGLNPFGTHNYLMRSVRAVNEVGEDVAKVAVWIDRIKKGYSESEAMQAAAKFIYNYDELSGSMKVMRNIFPFWTWPYKTWGLGMWTAIHKPDKFAKFYRTVRGIEEMDPLSEKDKIIESYMDKAEKEYQQYFRFPFMRGKEGGRTYMPLANLFPLSSMTQIEPANIGRAFIEMSFPVFRYLAKKTVQTERQLKFSPFGVPGEYYEPGYTRAPNFINSMMAVAKYDYPKTYAVMSKAFKPRHNPIVYQQMRAKGLSMGMSDHEAQDYALAHTPIMYYIWDRGTEQMLKTVDPGLAKVISMAKSRGDQENYDRFLSWLVMGKPFEYGERQATYNYLSNIIDTIQKLLDINKRYAQRGVQPGKPTNLLKSQY